uniref:Uncharacterized protein n=1 Tax=Caulobacter sp. (strain K31) TaxID=366602 RepID=B0SWN3_CAUSK
MPLQESRLKVGVDVPWVTSWSEEEGLGVRPCPSIGGRLAICQAERPGLGRPQYSMNHFRRQRETVGRMLCPMCGEPTVSGDRWTQIAKRVPAGLLRAKGLGAAMPAAVPDERIMIDAGSIAPLHEACVRRSLEHCPHLRGHPGVEVMAWPEHWTVAPLLVQATAPPPPLAVLATPRPAPPPVAVVSFLQIFGLTEERDPRWRRRLRELKAHAH